MSVHRFLLVLAALLLSMSTVLAQPMPSVHVDLEQANRLMLAGVNRYRADHGLRMVQLDPEVSQVASNYARRMVGENFFAHLDPAGNGPQERLAAAGLPWPVSENLGAMRSYGLTTPQIVDGLLRALIASPVHRANLLDPRATHLGLGFAQDKDNQTAFMDLDISGHAGAGTVIVAQEFVRKPLKSWSGEVIETVRRSNQSVPLTGEPVEPFAFVAVEVLDRASRKLVRYQQLPVVSGSFAAQLQWDVPGKYEVRVLGLHANSLLQSPEPLGVFLFNVPEGEEYSPTWSGVVF